MHLSIYQQWLFYTYLSQVEDRCNTKFFREFLKHLLRNKAFYRKKLCHQRRFCAYSDGYLKHISRVRSNRNIRIASPFLILGSDQKYFVLCITKFKDFIYQMAISPVNLLPILTVSVKSKLF